MATIYCKLFPDAASTASDNGPHIKPLASALRVNKRFAPHQSELGVHFPLTEISPLTPDHFQIEVKDLNFDNIFVLISGFIPGCKDLCAKYKIGFGYEVIPEWWYSRALVASAYVRFGFHKMLNMIRGEYSVILMDRRDDAKPLVYVATDRIGAAPMYSHTHTHLNGLVVSFSNARLPGSKKLAPGYWELLSFSNCEWRQIDRKKYFAIEKNWFDSLSLTPFQYIIGTMHDEIRSIIPANRKVVCTLSGGLFSSVMAVILSKYVPQLSTIFVGVTGGARGFQSAMIVSEKLGTRHTNILMDDYDFCRVAGNVICLLQTADVHAVRDGCVHYLAASGIASQADDDATVFLGECGGNIFSDHAEDDQDVPTFDLGAYFRMSPRRKLAKPEEAVARLDQIYRRKFGISLRLPYFTSTLVEFASRHEFFREEMVEWLESQIPESRSEYFMPRPPITSAFPVGVLYDMTVRNFANVNELEYYSEILAEMSVDMSVESPDQIA